MTNNNSKSNGAVNALEARIWMVTLGRDHYAANIYANGDVKVAKRKEGTKKWTLTGVVLTCTAPNNVPLFAGHPAIPQRVWKWMSNEKVHGNPAVVEAFQKAKIHSFQLSKETNL